MTKGISCLLNRFAILFALLFTLGVGQMWGTWYVPGTISYDGSERWSETDNSMGGDNKQITFWALPAGTYKFQLTNGSSWSGNSCITETEGSDLSTGTEGKNATFTITKPKNITIKVTNESTWKVKVSAATPCAYIRYNWNEAGWNWSAAMSHNGDGTCSCIGQYGNTKAFDWQFSSAEQHYNDGTSGVTLVGNPQKGDKCVFTYNQSDQSLEIRKCNTTEATSYIYFDNTETGWTNTYKYFVIGRPVDATNPYSVTYALTEITNTKLWYHESTATWGDAGYYAAIGSNATFGTGNWNCDNLATASKYTAAYTSQYNLANTNHNIITPASSENGAAITMESKGTTYSSLNSLTVGYKYVVDGSDMASGGAPAQITMNSYVFNAHNTVTGNAAQTINANASGTYSKSITAAYRGKVVLTQSNLSDGYKFIGWYNGNTQKETNNEYTYYPNENTTISAKYEYRWTLKGTFPNETAWEQDHYISNFSINASSEDVGYLDIDLPGNTSFQFKVVDRTNNAWHSCSGTSEGSEYHFTYLSDKEKDCSTHTGDEKNMVFHTAASGTYRFTWNADTKTLTVTYPASYKVTYDDNGSTGGTVPTDNDYYAANATVTVKGNGGSLTKTGYNTLAYWNTKNDGSGTDIAISTGTFSITDNTTLYAKWTPAILTYVGGTGSNWNTTANWSPACVPTIDHDVVLNVPVEVNIDHAVAKSIVIDQNWHTGSLTIQANKGLEVAGTISKTMDGETYSATTPADLVLESSASGNATLIFNNSNNCQATVQMYSKGWTTGTQGSGTWNWQMIGTPVTDATRINDYYDGYMYKWSSSGWVDMTDFSETLTPFAAYSATYPTTSDNLHTYSIDGTLVPTGDKSIDIPTGTSVYAVANSWTAPIYVKNITFSSEPANVYIFNTGYAASKAASGDRWAANTYHAVPVNSSPFTGDTLIASMQGFFVKTTSGTMTINYDDVVRPTGTRNINAGAMHAPKRAMAAEPVVMKIYVSDSLYDDRVVLLARNDFSRGFDNGWDGEKFQVNAVTTAPRIFAINETGGKEEVSAIPELENTVLGFRPGTEETYTIHFDYNGDETLYLRDTRTGSSTLITNESEYIFLSDGTNEDARFIISRIQSTPTGVEETGAGSKAYKLMIEDHIYIIRDGRMYSIDGALVNLERK